MQVFTHTQAAGVLRRTDIQIQAPCAKLGIALTGANDAKIRIRHISPSQGTKVIQDLVSVKTLLEASTFSEGFFFQTTTMIQGTLDLSESGSLDLKDGYLSVDLDTEAVATLTACTIHAIEAPTVSNKYLSYNPVYMAGGITREISLTGVCYIVLPIDSIKTIDIDYSSRSVSYDTQELKYIANDINDIVSVQSKGTVSASAPGQVSGYDTVIRLEVSQAARLTVTPINATPFMIYLGEERVL